MDNYVNLDEIKEPGDISISLLDMLNRVLGIGFEVNDGKLGRVCYSDSLAQGGI